MKHRIATITAAVVLLAGCATAASTASARGAFKISIGLPGFAVGYAHRGSYIPPPLVSAPPLTSAPGVVYYGAPFVSASAPFVYGPRVVFGRPVYRPFY